MSSLAPRLDALEKNYLINGGFDFWQRGTSFATTATTIYSADRFFIGRDAFATGGTISRQAGGNIQFCARVQRDNGNTGTGRVYLIQLLELPFVKDLVGKTVTLSCKMRRGANFSAASNQVRLSMCTGTAGTQESSGTYFNAGFTGQVRTSSNVTIASTSSFDTYSMNLAVPSGTTNMSVELSFLPVGTAGAADYFEVSEMALTIAPISGNVKDFTRASRTYAEELSLCQRYYWSEIPSWLYLDGYSLSAGGYLVVGSWRHPQPMRTTPTMVMCTFGTQTGLGTPAFGVNTSTGFTINAVSTVNNGRMILQGANSNMTADAEI